MEHPPNTLLGHHLSFKELLLDLFNSHGGRKPLKGDCRNKEDVDNCFCRMEIEDRQLNALRSLLFSLSYDSQLGSCCTAEILRASGRMQLQIEPARHSEQIINGKTSLWRGVTQCSITINNSTSNLIVFFFQKKLS